MAVKNKDLPRFAIVSHRPHLKRVLLAASLLWLALAIVWGWLFWRGLHTDASRLRTELGAVRGQLADARAETEMLKQRLANAERAEFVSRSANNRVQEILADKGEQIAGLKADLDFYERLVGTTDRRHGLRVHNIEFKAVKASIWRYTITLTQNINRGGLTSGQIQFALDGMSGGKMKSVEWPQLLQKPGAPAQVFSFRYFQQIEGDVMLPPGFIPQRVRVKVSSSFGKQEQLFEWTVRRALANPDL